MPNALRRPFGTTAGGQTVEVLTLDNGLVSCQLLTLGAALRSLLVPDRDGRPVDVVLGYDALEDYLTQDGYLGATVGRVANRIARGRFTLNGEDYALAVNNGPNHLHGGLRGFSHRVWTVDALEPQRAVLSLTSPHGEEGYPGTLRVQVTYALEGTALSIRYRAVTDRDTPVNLTNHSYFNLSGQGSGPVTDHRIRLFAQGYTPADKTSIPFGRVEPVAGTPMDLTALTPLASQIDADFDQLAWAGGYDHNYVIDGEPGTLRPAALVESDDTGVRLTVDTTLPGVQVYTANFLTDRAGKGAARYGRRGAVCLETQFFPDSPNQPSFPSCILRPGAVWDQETRFTFSVFE